MKKFLQNNFLILISVILMLALTLFAFLETRNSVEERRKSLFDFRVMQAKSNLEYRVNSYTEILKAGKALFYVADTVTRQDWQQYVASIDINEHFPGIQGFGYAVLLEPHEVENHIGQVRAEGFKDFDIYPEGERDWYSSIIYLEPFRGRNLRAFGYDMFSHPVRKEAMIYALENNEAAVSAKVELVQETGTDVQAGFLIYLPLYENNEDPQTLEGRWSRVKGFVYYPFRMDDFINATFGNEFDDIRLAIYDGVSMEEEDLMFSNIERVTEGFDRVVTLSFNNHRWSLKFVPTAGFGRQAGWQQPLLVIIIGLLITFIVAFTVWVLAYTRRKALLELEYTRAMEQKKDEFIGIASHELRTPLTSSKAYVDLLKISAKDEQQRILAEKATQSLNKLNILIHDLLDVTRIQAGRLQLAHKEFELQELLAQCIEIISKSYPSHTVEKTGYSEPLIINGDPIRLEQAVVNFLSNAIKYSPRADKVMLDVQNEQDQVQVMVQDFGIGIPEDQLTKIFEKFHRVGEVDENISGLGMGLHIASEIIKLHEGEVWVESEVGAGSKFYFTLPVK